MKSRVLIFATLVLLSSLFMINEVDASCGILPPIFNEIRLFDEAHTIFVGKVLDVHHSHTDNSSGMEPDTFTFDVDYYLKGKLQDNDVMSHHSSVGYDDFVEGQSYLVYAFGGIDEVNACSSPILLSVATPVLILFYFIQYSFVVIPIIIGGIIFIVWRKRK